MLLIDIETTGLKEREHTILEVGAFALNEDLTKRAEFHRVLHWPYGQWDDIDPKVVEMHTASGLWRECAESRLTIEDVDEDLYHFVLAHCGQKAVMCGRSIHFDRRFIDWHFVQTPQALHYRMADVSAMLFLSDRWGGRLKNEKATAHRAIPDCEVTLNQLRMLRHELFERPRYIEDQLASVNVGAILPVAEACENDPLERAVRLIAKLQR